jgi:hypothetical protein
MTTTGLSQTVMIQLDASGNGTASMGPLTAREVWNPDNAHVQVATDTNEAICNIYVGDAPQQRCFRDNTASGSIGDATDRVQGALKNPHKIWAVWTGGDPKAMATLTVTGTREI